MPRRHNSKGRSNSDARHVRLYHWLMNSEAWNSLTPQARSVYIELERRHNGSNNGEIRLSVREAAQKCRISKDTAARALRELQEKGFLHVGTPGAFSCKLKRSTEWILTQHKLCGDPPTQDFMRWRADNLKHGPKSG